jgi:hypothetical protein
MEKNVKQHQLVIHLLHSGAWVEAKTTLKNV